jgi:hypothetical protein
MEVKVTALEFEQLPREHNKAYAAFKIYLELGVDRSLSKVATKMGKTKRLMQQYSAKFDWPGRVRAHAAYVAELERKAIEARVVEKAVEWEKIHESVRREAWKEAEKTIEMVRKARAEWEESGRLPGWTGMARMLQLAFDLKKFAAGMPNEVKEINTQVAGKIDVEWELAIQKAYGKKAAAAAAVVDVEAVKAEPPRQLGSGTAP